MRSYPARQASFDLAILEKLLKEFSSQGTGAANGRVRPSVRFRNATWLLACVSCMIAGSGLSRHNRVFQNLSSKTAFADESTRTPARIVRKRRLFANGRIRKEPRLETCGPAYGLVCIPEARIHEGVPGTHKATKPRACLIRPGTSAAQRCGRHRLVRDRRRRLVS